jgi:hypothetical protein
MVKPLAAPGISPYLVNPPLTTRERKMLNVLKTALGRIPMVEPNMRHGATCSCIHCYAASVIEEVTPAR